MRHPAKLHEVKGSAPSQMQTHHIYGLHFNSKACKVSTARSAGREPYKRNAPYLNVQSIDVKHCAITNVKTCI